MHGGVWFLFLHIWLFCQFGEPILGTLFSASIGFVSLLVEWKEEDVAMFKSLGS